MKSTIGKSSLICLTVLAALVLAQSSSAVQTFIDWRGGFYFQYPDNWYEIEYRQVNIFLGSQNVSRDEFDYDVALAAQGPGPFWETVYVFVSSFKMGKLNEAEIDSALKDISSQYGTDCRSGTWSTGEYPLELGIPVYDKSIRTVAVRDMFRGEGTAKMLLQMRVFHDEGAAVFSCYAPDSVYRDVEKDFFKLATSLTTGDLHEIAPKESTQVVDLSQREVQKSAAGNAETGTETSSKPRSGWLIIILGLVVLAAVCYFILNKKKNR